MYGFSGPICVPLSLSVYRPRLTKEVKQLITEIHLNYPKEGPTSVRQKLLREMKESGLDRNFGPDWPGVGAVGKQLQEIRAKNDARAPELKGLDAPWSFGALAEHPIAPEAIPLLVSIYEQCWSEDASGEWLFSIREALWIARLHKMIELYLPKHSLPLPNTKDEALRLELGQRPAGYQIMRVEDLVLDWAYTYSQYQIMSELDWEEDVKVIKTQTMESLFL